MNKRYAIFDMDGTMVNSMVYWDRLGEEFLRGRGITSDLTEVLELARPMTLPETAELFLRYFSLPDRLEDMIAEMGAIMEAHYQNDVQAKPGIFSCLEQLTAEGVQMCVVSSTAERLVRLCLERLGLLHHFRFLLSCESFGVGKHRPDAYLAAAERLGAQPSEIAVYEDAIYAVRTAKAAGFYVVAVYDEPATACWQEMQQTAHEAICLD